MIGWHCYSKKRFSIRSRTKSASASSSKEGSTKPKIPPPRPPPPSGSVSKAQLEAVSSLDQSKEPTLELKEPTLETKEPILEFGMYVCLTDGACTDIFQDLATQIFEVLHMRSNGFRF